MNQSTPAIRELARHLLTLETSGSEYSKAEETEAHTAATVFEKLRTTLSKLVGVAGFQALLSRALALAKAEASWLQAVRVRPDGTLEGFMEAAQQQSAEMAAEGGAALLAQLLGLLVTFIGEALTLRLAGDIWPEARFDGRNSGTEETPA